MRARIHLIRASHLTPIIHYMQEMSVPVTPLLEQAELSHVSANQLNQVILEKNVWYFLELAAKFNNMPHLGFILAEQSHLSEYGVYPDQLLKADNLYQALHFLIHNINLHNNNSLFWLRENERDVWICRPKTPYSHDVFWQAEQHVMTLVCMVIEHYAGPGWAPKKIKLQDISGVGLDASRFFKNAEVTLGQPYSAVAIEKSLLKDRTLDKDYSNASSLEHIPDCFVQSFKQLLKQNYFGEAWLADNIAAQLGISVRTLKRKLHREDTSLRKIFDEIRFQQACHLIEQDVTDYTVLAEKLSYTHANNFVRAFKRWSGMTPREYIRLYHLELLKKNRTN